MRSTPRTTRAQTTYSSPPLAAAPCGCRTGAVFGPACARTGLDDARPHDLRHTAASLAVSAGANVKAVQRMLGHASAAMTLDVYARLFGDDLDAVADGLDALRVVPQMCHTDDQQGPSETAAGA
jgi:hypothetical protein